MNAKVSAKALTKAGEVLKVVGVAAALLVGSSSVFAEPHGGGFGGGHMSGGHFSAPQGGASHGPGVGHFSAAPHYSAGQHFSPGHVGGYSYNYGHAYGYGHGSGYSYGGHVAAYGYRPNWGGGYWHGGYWPRAYYGWSYPLYLGFLPAVYATYWWGGLPYYYVNNVYYTYSAPDNGYVAVDPPPVAGDYTDDVNAAAAANGATDNTPADVAGAVPDTSIIAYPRNGQSDQQQATDKFECHGWAKAQSGFDPTSQSSAGVGPSARTAYGRAMAACLDARGYTVR
jgi:hypothetical protein